jgi:Arc/MetJ-type ribon-helix-helix transcriptional regulator
MATTTTRQLREPFVETAGIALTEAALPYLKKEIPTATYTGRQFVAGQTDLEQQAREQAAQLQAGPEAYKAYMSPYQQEVIDTSIAALEREQAKGLGALRQRAAMAGAFGGGREAAQMGEYQATSDIARAALEAQLRQQGFQQAQQAAIQGLTAQQGLGTYQTQLGGAQRQIKQAQLAADQEAAREAAFEPFTRLGLIGPQLASVIGGFPAATQLQTTPPPSTTQQLLGLGIGAAGLGGAVKSLFG